jgi:hypothetical protein
MLPLSLTVPLRTVRIEHSAAPLARRAFSTSAGLLAGLPHMPNSGCHETEYFCTALYIIYGAEDRQFIHAAVMGDAPTRRVGLCWQRGGRHAQIGQLCVCRSNADFTQEDRRNCQASLWRMVRPPDQGMRVSAGSSALRRTGEKARRSSWT